MPGLTEKLFEKAKDGIVVNHELLEYLKDDSKEHQDLVQSLQGDPTSSIEKLKRLVLKQYKDHNLKDIKFFKYLAWSGQGNLCKLIGYNDKQIKQWMEEKPSLHKPQITTAGSDPPMEVEPDTGPGHNGAGLLGHMASGYAQGYGQGQYGDTGYQPGAAGYQLGAAGYQQGATGYQQGAAGYQPGYQPGATGYQPGTAGYQPGTASYSVRTEVGPAVIIYAKDDDPDDEVQMLSELLRRFGVNCDIDQYHNTEKIANWDHWWEAKIKQISGTNGFILLMCSPTLTKCLSSQQRLEMKEGSISSQLLHPVINNHEITTHLLPVFLDQYVPQDLPISLTQRKSYALLLRTLTNHFDLENITAETMSGLPDFNSLVSLAYKLTGQPEVEKPPVAQVRAPPIPRPATVPVQETLGQDARISDRDIQHLVELIDERQKSWSKLAIRLGVKMRKIQEIRDVCLTANEQAENMLKHWRDIMNNHRTKSDLEEMLNNL